MSTPEKLPPQDATKSAKEPAIAPEPGVSGPVAAGAAKQEETLREILQQVTPTKKATATAGDPPGSPPGAVPTGHASSGKGADAQPKPSTLRDTVDEIAKSLAEIEEGLEKLDSIEQTLGQSQELDQALNRELTQARAEASAGIKSIRDEVDQVGRALKTAHDEVKLQRTELAPILAGAQRDREALRSAFASTYKRIVKSLHTVTETRREVQALQASLATSDGKALTHRDELKKEIAEVEKTLGSLSGRIQDQLIPGVKALSDAVKDQAERTSPVLDDVNRRLGSVENSLRDSVVPQILKTTEAAERVSEHTRQLDKHLRGAHQQFQQALVTDLDTRLGKVTDAAAFNKFSAATEQGLREIHHKQEQTQKSLDGLQGVLTGELTARLDRLAANLTSLGGAATASDKSLEDVAERVERIERSVGAELERRIDELECAISAAQKTLSTVSTTADIQLIHKNLDAVQAELRSAMELVETRLGDKLDAALGVAQQAAAGAASNAQGVGELKEPVGALKRSVGDALEVRLGIVQRDLGELGRELKTKLEGLSGALGGVQSALTRTVVPGLEQTREATEALGARLDKRAEHLEAAVADAAKNLGKAVKERVDAVTQAVSQIGGQRSQDQAVLLQQIHQLRTDVTGPMGKLCGVVTDGLIPRIDGQAGALGELQRGSIQRLGELSSTLGLVKQSTDSLSGDLSAALSTLDRLAAAVPLHQTTLLGELSALRAMIQDGLVGGLRSSSRDLKDQVLALDGKVEARVELVKNQIGQLADRSAQQHADVVASVSAIRELVHGDGTQNRLNGEIDRKLDETKLCVTVLATNVQHQHTAVLDDIALSKNLLESLPQNVQRMFDKLKMELEQEFAERLGSTLSELNKQTDFIYKHIVETRKSSDVLESAKIVKDVLEPDFARLSKQLGPLAAIETIAKGTKEEMERPGGDLKQIKGQLSDVETKFKAFGVEVESKIKSSWKAVLIQMAFLASVALVLCFVVVILGGRLFHDKDEINQIKNEIGRVASAQELLNKNAERSEKLLCLAAGASRKLGGAEATIDSQLAEIKTAISKPSSSAGRSPSPPVAPQVTNTNMIAVCSSCATSGQDSGAASCVLPVTAVASCERGSSPEQKEQRGQRDPKDQQDPGASKGQREQKDQKQQRDQKDPKSAATPSTR